jgi:hypothetical protein
MTPNVSSKLLSLVGTLSFLIPGYELGDGGDQHEHQDRDIHHYANEDTHEDCEAALPVDLVGAAVEGPSEQERDGDYDDARENRPEPADREAATAVFLGWFVAQSRLLGKTPRPKSSIIDLGTKECFG